MNKIMKILAVLAAVLLIIWDVFTLSDLAAAESAATGFGIWMRAMLPCGVLFGITMLLHQFQKSAKKPLAIITAVFFGGMALIRILALVVQFMEIAACTAATDAGEILLIVEFYGYVLLAVAAIFLMIFIVGGGLRRTTLTLFAISAGILLVGWIIVVYQQISEMMFAGAGFLEIVFAICSADFIWSVTSLIAYTLCFGWSTGVLSEPTKPKE